MSEAATLVPAAAATPVEGQPTPAPAPAPVAPPPAAPEAPLSIDAPAHEQLSAEPVTYDPSGDPVLDLALDFVGRMGFRPEHPAMEAAAEGNFDLLKAEMKKLGSKAAGWEKYVAAGERAYQATQESKANAVQETRTAVMSVMGDEQTWSAVQAWAAANADPKEKVAVNAGLAAGGVQAKAMALYLKQCFDNAGGPKAPAPQGANPVANQVTGAPGSTALSPRQYVNAVQELRGKYPGRSVEELAEYRSLQQRRSMWRG